MSDSICSASGLTRLTQRIALIGEGDLGAVRCSVFAMPQAIEWSLATPMIRPRFPSINPGIVAP